MYVLGAESYYDQIDLQWWDGQIEEWKAFTCESGVGPCLSFDIASGHYRVLSAYIQKGTKLTVHVTSIGESHEYQVLIRSGEPPTESNYDYQLTRKEPGFTQWSCRGVPFFFRVALPNGAKTKKSKFGVTLTLDNCSEKDYIQRCPGGWKDKGDGWCIPPKWYNGPCKKQNFFGEYDLGREYTNPASKRNTHAVAAVCSRTTAQPKQWLA
ncbi:hypothetical protein CYMTET_3435 [Cymbomonas tetramitiformis]|uniref:CPW-WPC domain-containing protein n=1 Tax=Cymbomonas tetramitiformis TaxID=36881 RepID=A0AAE0LLD9_9CHLO|nr:hypothetical protein CYMTET_3435 [Cymbomonas tetramitiformis]